MNSELGGGRMLPVLDAWLHGDEGGYANRPGSGCMSKGYVNPRSGAARPGGGRMSPALDA